MLWDQEDFSADSARCMYTFDFNCMFLAYRLIMLNVDQNLFKGLSVLLHLV